MKIKVLLAVLAGLLILPSAALAGDGTTVDNTAVYAALVGSLVPIATYFLNHRLPFIVSEPAKAFVLVLVSAAGGALTKLLDEGSLTWSTNTLSVVGVAVLFAFLAHAGFYRPSTISKKLGGGSNRPRSGHH